MKMVSWMWRWGSKAPDDVAQEDLKKGGFDPQDVPVEQLKDQSLKSWENQYEGFICPSYEEAQMLINHFKQFPNEDQHRHALAYPKGGKICGDKQNVNKIRSIGKEMLKIVGKKVVSGDFNLTKISFPIRAMVPKTSLQNSTIGCCMMPYFMNRASQTEDPVQRMKLCLSGIVSAFYHMNLFLKPLNPILGETLQGQYSDGTKVYCEQVSHHPPVSFFLLIGPNDSYRYWGSYDFEATAGLNSMNLVNRGKRAFEFKNGDIITGDFNREVYSGVFLGTLRSEGVGGFKLTDEKNKISAEVKYGKIKKKPSDYFVGQIIENGKAVSKFDGTYCGYLNFDGIRYWDGRYLSPFKVKLEENSLESDFRKRQDLKLLRDGNFQQAQIHKQRLELIQRNDAKLRAAKIAH